MPPSSVDETARKHFGKTEAQYIRNIAVAALHPALPCLIKQQPFQISECLTFPSLQRASAGGQQGSAKRAKQDTINEMVGKRIRVLWPDERQFFSGTVTAFNPSNVRTLSLPCIFYLSTVDSFGFNI